MTELIEQGILSPFQMILQFGLELRTLNVLKLLSLLPTHPQGRSKLFTNGQAKLNSEYYVIKCMRGQYI